MNCTLVFNLLPDPDIKVIGVGWFLGLIFLFYMLFPFFVFLIDNKRRAWAVFGISLVVNFLCQEYFFTEEFVNFDVGRHNIEIYLCHMVMFRVVEKVHFEKFIHDSNILFLVTCAAGIGLTIMFSYCMKKTINRVITR